MSWSGSRCIREAAPAAEVEAAPALVAAEVEATPAPVVGEKVAERDCGGGGFRREAWADDVPPLCRERVQARGVGGVREGKEGDGHDQSVEDVGGERGRRGEDRAGRVGRGCGRRELERRREARGRDDHHSGRGLRVIWRHAVQVGVQEADDQNPRASRLRVRDAVRSAHCLDREAIHGGDSREAAHECAP
jgi:hypothetical protein